MNSRDTLSQIPVVIAPMKASNKLHWQRRGLQIATLLLAILVPVTGLFRIDVMAGAFVILDYQIWWADFFLVFGLWLLLASSLVLVYSTLGTAFCGWSCPQNTLAEWANMLTRKLLGKRADVNLDGARMQVASQKNKLINWLILLLMFSMAAMLMAIIPLLYFYPPDVIWSFITFRDDERLAASIHYIYFIFALVFLLDIAFIRHFWCRFMCIYKVWQHGFKTKQTLHITYDESRSDLCEKCNYCVTACFLDLDPRKTEIFDTCINCGECITACNKLQAKKGRAGLLSFQIGERKAGKLEVLISRLSSLSTRANWTLPFAALGLFMFTWGIISYDNYHLAVHRADILHGAEIRDYRVALSNKRYKKATLVVAIDGLPEQAYTWSNKVAEFSSAGRIDLNLHIDADLKPGLHSFIVHVNAQDGWHDSYRVQHFVAKS